MRTIKFRGKRKGKAEWVFGDLLTGLEGDCYIIITHEEGVTKYEVNPDSVGQYTGLKDKKGKEIYEGDMLRFPAKDQHEQNNFVAYEIFWHDNECADRHIGWQMNRQHFQGSLCGNDMGVITFLPRWTEKMEVIGNIHDNLEIFEGGDK